VTYLLVAAALLPIYARVRNPSVLLALGPLIGFFGTGFFAGFGAVVAEIFPTAVRGSALGITYNLGRVVSAVAPFTVGSLAQSRGFSLGFGILSLAFLGSALMWFFLPETRGRDLT
jgi:nitrate/nitrite transporter NarK